MLDFFRRHQRYFYVMITIVIVISFSFFGTYNTMSNSSFREQIAFTRIDGTDVTRHELDEMVTFLSTDGADKMLFGGAWGPNFLNDGVIKKDFLETGLAAMLGASYASDLQQDLATRFEKEKRWTLYTHPKAQFVGTESAWNYFAPQMTGYFNMLRSAQSPIAQNALQARIALFLMERQFPAPLLRQILRYQEKQHSWLAPDEQLEHIDLSIFGYHTVEDWFGPRFVRLVSEFIINAAEIAEQQGYSVSKAEALADLMRNSEISFQQNLRNPHLGVTSSQEYFDEQLRRLGMDRNIAARQWQQVLLFRRLFQDMGSSVFVDTTTFKKFDEYALASVDGQIYHVPKELRLNNYRSLQKFEIYLDAVSKRSEDDKAKLRVPTTFLSASEVTQKNPELVQKRYLLEIARVDKKSLEGNIGVKESWNWETENKGWELLKKEFPEIGVKSANTREERFAALDALDDKTRARVDTFARTAIVNEHPEWLTKALSEATPSREVVGIHEKGPNPPFIGLDNGKSLMSLLDAAALAGQDASKADANAKNAAAKLAQFSVDQNTYYRIVIIDRASQPEILTFAEADQQGTLEKLLDSKLEAYYSKIRDANPKEFQREDKTWKPLADVKDIVADRYFEKTLRAIASDYAAAIAPKEAPPQMLGDFAATLRLLPYMREVKDKLQKDPASASEWTRAPVAANNSDVLPVHMKLADQWKLESEQYQTTRSSGEQLMDKSELFAMKDGQWTKVNTPANGDLNFFHLKQKGNQADELAVAENVTKARRMLSYDAQQRLMGHLLMHIAAKNAISLEYLNKKLEPESSEVD